MEDKNILIIEDEKDIANVIKAYLQKEGYTAYYAPDGRRAFELLNQIKIDFIILDLMLPDLSGEEICQKIRLKSQVPILMLTAKAEEEDRIYGLNIGADDYLSKPFSPKELVARVKAILRRSNGEGMKPQVLTYHDGDLVIHLDNREVRKRGSLVDVTATELKLLSLFCQNPGKVFTREELIVKVLGYDYEGYDRTIDAHIKNLRHKIEEEDIKYILTVYGVGYKFMGDGYVK